MEPFKSLTGVDIDPASVKGTADLRIDFPLNLKHILDLPDLPVTIAGTLADIGVDKAFGKERLDAGRFTVSYDRGAFALKGDARVQGSPLTVDLRQPKPGVHVRTHLDALTSVCPLGHAPHRRVVTSPPPCHT